MNRIQQDGTSDESPADLDRAHPRTQAYMRELTRRIEANWVYPREAVQQGQSGAGVVALRLTQDGRLRDVDIVRSTGSAMLDRYIVNAIRLAAPFGSLPCKISETAIRMTLSFQYTLSPRTLKP